jgi:hypothetical protein
MNNEPDAVKMNNNPISLMFNLSEAALNSLKGMANNGVLMATEEKAQSRMEICSTCTCLEVASSRCKLCGCFMTTKVRLDVSKCPASKW